MGVHARRGMYDLAKRMATVLGKGHTMCMLPGSCDGELYVNLGGDTSHTRTSLHAQGHMPHDTALETEGATGQ